MGMSAYILSALAFGSVMVGTQYTHALSVLIGRKPVPPDRDGGVYYIYKVLQLGTLFAPFAAMMGYESSQSFKKSWWAGKTRQLSTIRKVHKSLH